MNRLVAFAVIALFVAGHSAFGAEPYLQARSAYAGSTTELAINGVSIGAVYSVEGGDARGVVVTETNATPTTTLKKHLGDVTYAPITVELSFPVAQPVLDCLGDFFANRQTRRTLLLTQYDFNLKPVGSAMQANNVLLAEVHLASLDASAKDPVRMTLVFSPETMQSVAPAATPSAAFRAAKISLTSNFEVHIGSLSWGKISRVEELVFKRNFASAAVSSTRDYNLAANLEFSNLLLTIADADSADWYTWRDNFLVKGNHLDSDEISGTLTLKDQSMKAYFTLQFSHVGIVRASQLKQVAGADSVQRFQAELYYESVAIAPPPPQPLTALPVAPVAGSLATATAVAVPAAAPASIVTNTADQGARDLKDFPRPDNSVRKSFTSVLQKTYQQDAVDYTAKDSLDTLEAFYTKNLKASGWDLNQRYENNNSAVNTHQIIMNWINGPRAATITMWELKAGGSEIAVTLKTTLTP